MYGPPGCGKTYISKATAGECEATFFNIKITDLMSPEEGVTEKRLHDIFERAVRNTPAIMFFDEIDAVAGRRSSGQKGPERRLVNQLLTEMDGFTKREGLMILGATNAPWDLVSTYCSLSTVNVKSREGMYIISSTRMVAENKVERRVDILSGVFRIGSFLKVSSM
ncbi:AAA family ATPase [Candidatus Altiarchaeota archaeon]